jgi:hypothetical protein
LSDVREVLDAIVGGNEAEAARGIPFFNLAGVHFQKLLV